MNTQTLRRKLRRRYALKQHNYGHLPRFSIFRSCKNIGVQIIDDVNGYTLASCSSVEKSVKDLKIKGYNIFGAKKIGELIAERALAKKINSVIFDIGAYKYHGKVKAIIETAIEHGLNTKGAINNIENREVTKKVAKTTDNKDSQKKETTITVKKEKKIKESK